MSYPSGLTQASFDRETDRLGRQRRCSGRREPTDPLALEKLRARLECVKRQELQALLESLVCVACAHGDHKSPLYMERGERCHCACHGPARAA